MSTNFYPINPSKSGGIQGATSAVPTSNQGFVANVRSLPAVADTDYVIAQQVLANGSTTIVALHEGQDEVQSIALGGATGGDYEPAFAGETVGTPIAFDATASDVQDALAALSTIGTGNVVVTGSVGGPFTVTFAGDLANQGQPLITIDTDSTTGGTGVAVTRTTHGEGQPDVARSVSIVANVSGVTGNVVVAGTDLSGAAITDTIALNGTSVVHGVKAFKTLTQVTFPARTHSGDTVDVGLGSKLGLHHKLSRNTVVEAALAAVKETTAPTVAVSSTVLSQNTVLLNSSLTGDEVNVHYLVDGGS